MLTGVFHVTFQSSLATIGEATIVCTAGGFHGANETHAFRGVQEADGARLVIEVVHLRGDRYPAFGSLPSLVVELDVTEVTDKGFRARGALREAHGIHVAVWAEKLCELAS